MGIQGLTKLLNENAPDSVKDQKLESYFGRRIAVDASMQIYSFMVVVGRTGDQMLTDADGNVTSHLQGMFFRTTRMMEAGLKPIFVFDGKPPEMKSDELSKRTERKAEAEKELLLAKERGDQEAVEKLSKRTVRVTREQTSECQRLLRLMGVPVVEAPSEAEAQCASLCKRGLAYAVATEDMDALTFGAPRLVRNLMAPASANKPVMEFDLPEVLKGLGLSQEEFVDLCILCGCDYTEKIGGIGPTRALALVKKYKRIENILDSIDATKYKIPAFFPYQQARKLFLDPEVLPEDSDEQAQDGGQAKAEPTKREETEEDHKASTTVQQEQTKEEGIEGAKEEEKGNEANAQEEKGNEANAQEEKDNGANAQEEEKGSEAAKMELNAPPSSAAPAPLQFKWPGPDEEGLVQFLVHEKGFNEDRVRSAAHRIVAAKSKSSQGRLDAFFAPLAGKAKPKAPAGGGAKRKAGAGGGGKFVPKRGKMGAFGKKK